MNKKTIFLFSVFFVICITITLVQGEEGGGAKAPVPSNATGEGGGIINETNISVKYDLEILTAFENQTLIPIIVRLIDNSNIVITGTKEERRELLKQKDNWFKPVIDEVLTTLSETEFELSSKRSDGFSGWISKKEFELLLNNSKVKSISWVKYGAHTSFENESKFEDMSELDDGLESKIIKKKTSWFYKIIQFLKSLFGLK